MTPAPKIATVPMGLSMPGGGAALARVSAGAGIGCRAGRSSTGRPLPGDGSGGQPLPASERRKNWRLAGRSAIRRTR